MMDSAFFDYVSSSAVSLVVSGNTGLSPFLTLFLLGLVEAGNPELLNMGSTMETILASWWSIGILGILTLGETIGKCIPAIDELIDSAETFIVPVISVLASLATMGMLPVPGGGEGASSDYNDDTVGKGEPIDVLAMLDNAGSDGFDGDYRLLDEEVVGAVDDVDGNNDFGEAFMTFTKVTLVITGIGLSLLIHMLKMLLRVSSLVCTGGCCQPCVTVLETVLVVFGVVCAILAPVFAIVACVFLLIGAAYVIRTKCCNNKKQEEEDDDDNAPASGDSKRQKKKSIRATTSERNDYNDNNSNNDDIENQKPSSHNSKKSKRNTSITAATAPMDTTMTEEAFAECEYNKSTTTTTTQKNNTNNPSAPSSSDYSYAVAEVVATLPPATAPANHHTTSTTKPDVEATMY